MTSGGPKMDRDSRRESLLDVTAQLIERHSLDAVSMDAVAVGAGVSRPLVYKHFASRDELLAALYQREVTDLHERMSIEVAAATSLEDMFRRLARAALRASAGGQRMLAQLRAAGAWTREVTRDQRSRDAATARAFSRRAAVELGLDSREAAVAIRLLLGMIDNLLAQYRADPTKDRAALLEETYVMIVRATLAALSSD